MTTVRATLARFSKTDWRYFGLMLVTQLFSVVYQTAMTQQFAASVTRFRAGLHIVFGLVHILYAAGMYLAYLLFRGEFRERRLDVLLGGTGVAVIVSLGLCLQLNVVVPSSAFFLPATVALIAISLTLFGMLYSALLTWFHARHREAMGVLVAVSLVGLILGFAAAPEMTIHLGNNLLLVATGLACVLLAFGRPGAVGAGVVVIAAIAFPRVDAQIERLRDVQRRFEAHSYEQYLTKTEMPRIRPIFDGWSPYAKINLFELPGSSKLAGSYNYYITWIFDGGADRRRQQVYGFVEPDDKVLMLAVGGGWPLMSLPTRDKEHVVGVELDPVVVDFFQRNPQYNQGLFNDVQLVRSEGRAALDTLKGPFDAIIVDLPGSPASPKENPIEFENYLLTREAIDRAVSLLAPDGILVLYLLPHQTGPAYATVKASGLPYRTAYAPLFDTRPGIQYPLINEAFGIYVSRDKARLDAVVDGILARSPIQGERVIPVPPPKLRDFDEYELATDDLPFNQFRAWVRKQMSVARMSTSFGSVLLTVGVSFAVVLLLSLAIIGFAGRRSPRAPGGEGVGRGDLLFFLLIGVGYVMLQLYLYARMRSYFGDPIRTVLLATALLFASNSAGSLFAGRVAEWRGRHPWLWGLLVAALVAFTHVGLGALPFGSTSFAWKLLAATLVIVPFGLVSGVFFPLGLMRLDNRALGWGLALDGAGTFLGFVLFYLTAWYYGISTSMWPVLGSYVVAAVLAGRRTPSA